MGEKIKIDLPAAQMIIDEKQAAWTRGLSPFLQEVAGKYNSDQGTNIDWQNFRLRVNSGALHTDVKVGKRGIQEKLTSTQKEKMLEGRKEKAKNNKVITPQDKLHTIELTKRLGQKHSAALKAILGGSLTSAVREHCRSCVGRDKNYVEDIRNCSCFGCELWSFRPYKDIGEKVDDGEDEINVEALPT